ncbi:hypothetical protein [Shewanella sp. MBTL60-007]|uniref:hypothetical protein n=1 Tax=Shewanella sp. MBTL60-007 TaxID=2815911 RepID=UPI001BC01A8B|nr:hypothetical protein [Shewanella sp. MBTL60-007]GIU31810.1 hypothetical protein TUM3792_43860 [Shewanella sp. MBTL60-007]
MENKTSNVITDLKVGFCNFGENWVKPTPITEIINKLHSQEYASNIKSYQEQVVIYGKEAVSKYDHIPLFIPHSIYENTRKRTDNGQWLYDTFELSNIIHADLDGVPSSEFENVWSKLENTNPLFMFKSPNGGIKCFWVHSLESTLLTKRLFMLVCRMFVKDTLNKLDLGSYYDHMPTTPNSNCFFSGGDGFILKSNVDCFKAEHVQDLNPYLKDVALLDEEKRRLEKVINNKRGEVEVVGWSELSEERRAKIDAKIEKFADDMLQDVLATNSKSKGNNQSYRLACCCKGLGVGYDRAVIELSKLKSRLHGAAWCPRDKASAAFQGASNSEAFNKNVSNIPEEKQLIKINDFIKTSERIPTPTFNDTRVSLDAASGIIKDGILEMVLKIDGQGDQFLAWVITPGTGKSEAVKDSVFEIVNGGYKVAYYLDNKRDMREVEADLFNRCPVVKVNDNWSYRKFTTCIQTLKGRESFIDTDKEPEDPKDHDYRLMCHMAATMKQKQIETASTGFPLLANYCAGECIHGLNGCGTKCEYLQQMRTDAQIRVYNHAYAHGKKSNFENREAWINTRSRGCGVILMSGDCDSQDRQDVVLDTDKVVSIVDEDIMKDLAKVDAVTTADIEEIETKDFRVDLLRNYLPEDDKDQAKYGAVLRGYNALGGETSKQYQLEFIRKLVEVARTSEEIAVFVESELELLFKVDEEIRLNNKAGALLSATEKGCDYMLRHGLNPNSFNAITGLSRLCKLENYGHFVVVPNGAKFMFKYFRKSKVNLAGSVIQLDGHAVEDILNRGYGVEFDFRRLCVELHKDANIVQVHNSTGSKQSLTASIQSDKNRPRFDKKVAAIAAKVGQCYSIGSKSIAESMGLKFSMTYGACRGSNAVYHGMLKDGKTLLMVNDYKMNVDGVELIFRAFYPELGSPNLSYNDKSEFVREMKNGIHEKTLGRRFDCPIVHSIYDFLSRSEVEQGIHRARPVRYGANVVCLFNTVLDFPISETVSLNDYLGLVDGRSVKSDTVKNANVETVVDSMKAQGVEAILDKRKAFIDHGLTVDQFKTLKPTPELMAQHGLETHEVVLVDTARRKSTAKMFAFPDANLMSIDFGKKKFRESKIVNVVKIKY